MDPELNPLLDGGQAEAVIAGSAANPSPGRLVDLGPVLDEGPWTAFQKRVLVIVWMVVVLDGIDTQTLTLALPAITREWGVGRAAFGPILAAGFVSMALGTLLAAWRETASAARSR